MKEIARNVGDGEDAMIGEEMVIAKEIIVDKGIEDAGAILEKVELEEGMEDEMGGREEEEGITAIVGDEVEMVVVGGTIMEVGSGMDAARGAWRV